jgi:CheY-like chemotaxis protein
MTDDLLDVARIARNVVELRREVVDLRAVIQTAVEAIRPRTHALAQTLAVVLPEHPVLADADPARLAQVFSNLLTNASKYTESRGHISLRLERAGAGAVIVVEDSGVGIPPAMLPRIFDMFTQLSEHRERTQGGLGIGLTLARRLVELHGGTIEAASEGPGRGSRFTVTLPPAAAEGRPGAVAAPAEPVPASACRVLVADDHADALEMMRLMLGFMGHEVRVARDGIEAVAVVQEFEPDLAFIDIGMPRMDGYEAARRIRAIGSPATLVALTGWGQDEDQARARAAGFDHHVVKPPDRLRLERLIAECGRRRDRR